MEELKLAIEIIQKIIDGKVVQSLQLNINGVSIPFIPSDIDITNISLDEGMEISHAEFLQRLENTKNTQLDDEHTFTEADDHSLLGFSAEKVSVNLEYADIDIDGTITSLAQLRINERLIPSLESISTILCELKDSDSKKIFCFSSNDLILGLISDYAPEYFIAECKDPKTRKYLGLQRLSLTLHEWSCHLLGDLDFIYYLESKAIVSWFHFMMTNSRSFHLPKLARKLPLIIRSEFGEIYLDKSERNIVKDDPFLGKYPEYKEARRNFDVMNLLISTAPVVRMQWWLILRTHQQQIIYFKDKKETGYRVFNCPYCKCCKRLSPGVKEAVHCGSPECKTKHETRTKSKKRPPRPPIPQGWIKAYDGKPRSCGGVCGEKRVLYVEKLNQHLDSQQLCRDCVGKSVAE